MKKVKLLSYMYTYKYPCFTNILRLKENIVIYYLDVTMMIHWINWIYIKLNYDDTKQSVLNLSMLHS